MRDFFNYTMLLVSIVLFNIDTIAQVNINNNVLDGAYVRETNRTKRVIPYPHLREADVMYFKRVWQEIDLRQKINHPYYFPVEPIKDRKNLFDVIKQGLLTDGSLIAYSTGIMGDDDEFSEALSRDSVERLLMNIETKPIVDLDDDSPTYGEVIGTETIEVPIESYDIVRYQIKEDWIWDRQRSERYIRIIGIAPIYQKKDDEGEIQGLSPLFWLYYPECRYVFAHSDVFNLFNDAQRRTYEDLFQKRYFSSYIIKESNVHDRLIKDYARGMDALIESERIKEELFLLEHDLWHY